MVYPDGKVENTAILPKDIEEARKLIKTLDIDKSYYGDRSELKFEKKICLINGLNDPDPEPIITNSSVNSMDTTATLSTSLMNRRQKIKLYITKKEVKHQCVPLFNNCIEGDKESSRLPIAYSSFKAIIDPEADTVQSLMKIGMYPITDDCSTF